MEDTVEKLQRELESKKTLTIETDLDRAVVDGNTWGPGLDDAVDNGEMSPRQASEWRRVMRRLNEKVAKEAGITSTFPMQLNPLRALLFCLSPYVSIAETSPSKARAKQRRGRR